MSEEAQSFPCASAVPVRGNRERALPLFSRWNGFPRPSRSHLLLAVSAMESTEIHKGTEIFTDTFKAETPYAHWF